MDAFGNALGNSIVGHMRFQEAKKNLSSYGQMHYGGAIQDGATPQEALARAQGAEAMQERAIERMLARDDGEGHAAESAASTDDSMSEADPTSETASARGAVAKANILPSAAAREQATPAMGNNGAGGSARAQKAQGMLAEGDYAGLIELTRDRKSIAAIMAPRGESIFGLDDTLYMSAGAIPGFGTALSIGELVNGHDALGEPVHPGWAAAGVLFGLLPEGKIILRGIAEMIGGGSRTGRSVISSSADEVVGSLQAGEDLALIGKSAQLRGSLLKVGIAVPAGYSAHHLIPSSLVDEYMDLFSPAAKNGYNINGAANGLPLPGSKVLALRDNLPLHSGGHTKEYFDAVRTELTELREAYEGGVVTAAQLPAQLDDISSFLSRQLLDRKLFLQNNDPAKIKG